MARDFLGSNVYKYAAGLGVAALFAAPMLMRRRPSSILARSEEALSEVKASQAHSIAVKFAVEGSLSQDLLKAIKSAKAREAYPLGAFHSEVRDQLATAEAINEQLGQDLVRAVGRGPALLLQSKEVELTLNSLSVALSDNADVFDQNKAQDKRRQADETAKVAKAANSAATAAWFNAGANISRR
jgi:hypothetical protein